MFTFSPFSRTPSRKDVYTFIDSPELQLELNPTAWDSGIKKASPILHSQRLSAAETSPPPKLPLDE